MDQINKRRFFILIASTLQKNRMHLFIEGIDHPARMMHQSEALIDHFSLKNDALLCNNNRSFYKALLCNCHDALKLRFNR